MTNIIKGLFFDLDGTLCDTSEANYLAYKKSFEMHGYSLSRKSFKLISNGLHAEKFIPMLLPKIKPAELKKIRTSKAEIYPSMTNMMRPNKKIIDFLAMMKPSHVTALVTTASKGNALAVLKEVGAIELFDFMLFGDDVSKPKPDPEAYRLALKQAKLSFSEVIAFEDSEAGIEAATKAGIKVIKVENI